MQRSYTKHNKKTKKLSDRLLVVLPSIALGTVITLGAVQRVSMLEEVSAVTHETNTSTYFSVESDLSLSITLPATTTLSVTPTASGTYGESAIPVTVSTNNIFGYSLIMNEYNPTSTSTRTTSLTNADASASIASIGSNMTADVFKGNTNNNTWGYSTDSGANFKPVAQGVSVGSNSTNGEHVDTVTFGTKVNDSIPNGSYSILLNFVATVTPPDSGSTRSTFENAFAYVGASAYKGYYKMQDMTDTICGYVYAPQSKSDTNVKSIQLIDTRDDKVYWVTKVGQNTVAGDSGSTVTSNCWMTQNLDLDLSTTKTLDSTNTDISIVDSTYTAAPYATGYEKVNGVWTYTPLRNTITTITSGAFSGYTNDNNTPYSADPGNWYWIGAPYQSEGSDATGCGSDSDNQYCSYLKNNGNASKYFQKDTAYAANGQHGHVGNYYNWTASIASNGSSGFQTQDATAANSICPKGWRLAIGADNATNDFKLVNNYYNSGLTGDTASVVDDGLVNSPLYFVRGGNVNSGTLYNAGRYGFYWSGTVYSSDYARYLYFRTSNLNPAYYYYRYLGRSVRCVAR